MTYLYTAILTPSAEDGTVYARVPDVPGCVTTGHDVSDAINQITDALNGCLLAAEDEGLPIAAPTPQPDIAHDAGDICALIRANIIAYRAAGTKGIADSANHR